MAPYLTGFADESPLIGVTVHVGTLPAKRIHFRADIMAVLSGAPALMRADHAGPAARQAGVRRKSLFFS